MAGRGLAMPASYIILEKDGKILIARRCNTGYQDGNYQIPAGHIDTGELPSEAAIREAKEEVGINLIPADLELVHISYRPKHDNTENRIDFFFRARTWSGEVSNMEPHKCDELRWVGYDELPDNTTFHVRDALNCVQNNLLFKEISADILKQQGLYEL